MPDDLKRRTKGFAKMIVELCRQIPDTREGRLVRDQLFRAGTSVGANYRAACRARSKAEFISKMGIVLEEADESLYWLEILGETRIMAGEKLMPAMTEANELIAIFVTSLRTAKSPTG